MAPQNVLDPEPKNDPDGGRKKSPFAERLLKIIQVLVTIGLLWWLLHDPARRTDISEAIARADLWWLLAAMVSAGACEFFGIIRWQLFLKIPLRLMLLIVAATLTCPAVFWP